MKSKKTKKPFQRRIFLFGKSGAGKTWLVGSIEAVKDMKEVLVVPLDAGDATLDGKDVYVEENARRIRDAEEIIWKVAQRKDEYAKVKTLVLDGLSEAAKRELQDIAEVAAKNENTKKPRDRDLNQVQDHLLKNGRLMRVIRMARDIPGITLIVTGWPKEEYPIMPDKNGNDIVRTDMPPTSIGPDFSVKMLDTVMGNFDDVWMIRKEADGRRFLYTSDYGVIKAKTRASDEIDFASELGSTKEGKFFPILVNPTFSDIVAAYERATSKQQAKEQVKK
jgi:hypothetical protein